MERRSGDGSYSSSAYDPNKWDHYYACGFQYRFFRTQPPHLLGSQFDEILYMEPPAFAVIRRWLGICVGWIADILRSAH